MLIQIFLILFFLFAIIKVLARYRAGDVALGWAILWALLWVAAGVVVLNPDWTMPIARYLGVGRGVDLIIYVSIALLFYLLFRMVVKIDRLEKKIVKLAREGALGGKGKEERGTRDK